MTFFFIIVYSITLVYFALSERVKKFIVLLAIQGVLLFGIVFFNLGQVALAEFLFVLVETIVVKSVVIPIFLNKVRRDNGLKRVHETEIPVFYSIIVVTVMLMGSFFISNYLKTEQIHTKFFTVAIASVFFGIYFIIIHKNVFSHLVGYLIIENGIFLLSLAVGSDIPMLVNLAVLLDVLMGVLVIGIFVNRVSDRFQSTSIDELAKLKD
jgi:hydrogenase-4 component E